MQSVPKPVPLMKAKKQTLSGEQTGRVCIVHFSHTKDREVKRLTERAFRTIHTAKSTRSASSNILHHLTDICKEIPEKYDAERHGIHSYCYQHFTNIPHVKAAVQRATALVALARSPRKPRRQPCSSTSASGKSSTVLLPQNRCLFCDKG